MSAVVCLVIAGNVLMASDDVAPVEPVVPEVSVSDEWEYAASLYLWTSSIGGETSDGADIDVSFSDILDNLDFVYMGDFRARKGKWGYKVDLMYLKLGNSPNTLTPIGAELTDMQLEAWIVTPTVAYRVMESEKLDLDVLAGARYLYMKPELTFSPGGKRSVSDSAWNGIVGIRGNYNLNKKWSMPFQFDVGTGDTDLTWQAFAGVAYKFENVDVTAGYRHVQWDFEDSDTFGSQFNEFSMSGPIFGATYRF